VYTDTTVYLQVGYRQDEVESTWYNSQVSLEFFLSKKKYLKFRRQTCMVDATLALEFVGVETKMCQFDTIS
jgi:hypothetical protein